MYFKRFTDSTIPNPDVILPYRLYFQITKCNQNVMVYENNKFDYEIWKEISEFVVENSEGKTGKPILFNINYSNI